MGTSMPSDPKRSGSAAPGAGAQDEHHTESTEKEATMILEGGLETGSRRALEAPAAGGAPGAPGTRALYAPGWSGTPEQGPGPFRAEQIRPGEPYELSKGHVLECQPTGGRGSGPNRLGASVVGWDPAVQEAGVDTGYAPTPAMLRAPDIAVGNVPDLPGWVPGAPDLAIEYADVGQDEGALQQKVKDLLEAGTKLVWVVRLADARRVEVHARGTVPRTAWPGELLHAPGILKNPVRVEALYDRNEAERATLSNLLQRQGYESLDAVRDEGRRIGAQAALQRVLARRGLGVGPAAEARIQACADLGTLERWLDRAVVATNTEQALE